MTPPLYTIIYSEAINRPEYYNVQPDNALQKLQDFPYLPGTYLISQGEGFCELLFTFVHLDRKIYQLIAKLVFDNNNYCWSFNERTFTSINELIFKSKLYDYCFLLFAYTPLFKIEGFVPALLTHEMAYLLARDGKEGDYFITETEPWQLKIVRFSRERNVADIYSLKANEKTSEIPGKYIKKLKLKRPVCLPGSHFEKEMFAINNLLKLTNVL